MTTRSDTKVKTPMIGKTIHNGSREVVLRLIRNSLTVMATHLMMKILSPSDSPTTQLARNLSAMREDRDAVFGNLFGEPAWDILLDLYARQLEGKSTTVTSAQIGSRCPPTTALRHIDRLIAERLIETYYHSRDSRVKYLRLSERAVDQMRALLHRHFLIEKEDEPVLTFSSFKPPKVFFE